MSLNQPDHLEKDYQQFVQAGISAVKTGDRKRAASLLMKATQMNGADALPWIWLSATTDDPAEQRKYLEYAVAADPGNAAARRGLVILSEKLDQSKLLPEGAGVEPRRPVEPEAAQAEASQCPKCGGHMLFDIQKDSLVCQYCGEAQVLEKHYVGGEVEQPVDYVLPTTRGHRWAEGQERVSCERCGAIAILPPGQTTDRCAYCGSNRLVTCAEAGDLVEPQAVGLMKFDAEEARSRAKKWLGEGFFAPDDLRSKSNGVELRPAYYPFWAFDGTLELSWRCEVNEGSSKNPHWVSRSGSEFQFFDDVLVPGMHQLDEEGTAGIEPFKLEELVEYRSEYLVGWQAFTYDRAMSDAILLAREKVVKQVRRSLYSRVEPGRQKRNLEAGAGKWSGLTFKYILLPLWAGVYTYRGKEYRLLINGQTGKVGGKRPRDNIKVALVAMGIGLILLFLGYIAYWLLVR